MVHSFNTLTRSSFCLESEPSSSYSGSLFGGGGFGRYTGRSLGPGKLGGSRYTGRSLGPGNLGGSRYTGRSLGPGKLGGSRYTGIGGGSWAPVDTGADGFLVVEAATAPAVELS
jgi:hypothetical protein